MKNVTPEEVGSEMETSNRRFGIKRRAQALFILALAVSCALNMLSAELLGTLYLIPLFIAISFEDLVTTAYDVALGVLAFLATVSKAPPLQYFVVVLLACAAIIVLFTKPSSDVLD